MYRTVKQYVFKQTLLQSKRSVVILLHLNCRVPLISGLFLNYKSVQETWKQVN